MLVWCNAVGILVLKDSSDIDKIRVDLLNVAEHIVDVHVSNTCYLNKMS